LLQFEFIYDSASGRQKIPYSTHKYIAISELKAIALEKFGLPADTESRLIDFYNDKFYAVLADTSQLEDGNIQEGQPILLDTKDSSGKWQHQEKKVKVANSGNTLGGTTRSYGVWRGAGQCGLQNLGNTCYFNSAVQCLLHTIPFVRHFLGDGWQSELNTTNRLGSGGKVVHRFADVVREAYRGSSSVIDPYYLKFEITKFCSQFEGYAQQDSHELLTYLLDAIHEDLNRCQERPVVDAVTGDGSSDEATARLAWENHLKRNDSVVVDLFHGQLRSTLRCPDCGRSTVVFDPYVAVPLPIQVAAAATTVPVVFVPLDMAEPPRGMRLVLPPTPTTAEVSAVISQAIGRDIRVVIGWKASTGDITWYGSISYDDDAYARYGEYWIFEIADESLLWVPCVLRMMKKTGTWEQDSAILGPFMVPVGRPHPMKDDLVEAAKERLAWLWKPEPEEPSHVGKETVVRRPDDDLSPSATSFKSALILPRTQSSDHGFLTADAYCTISRSCTVRLWLTPDGTNTASGFDLNELAVRGAAFADARPPSSSGSTSSAVELQDCFEFFSQPSVLDEQNQWFCPHCRQHVCAEKRMDIWSVPRILVIQLKRFITARYQHRKLDRPVSYPMRLDMAPFIRGPQSSSPCVYRLYAVSEHSGGLHGGHYTAHAVVIDANGAGRWFDFNDSSVWEASEHSAQNNKAYMLFYERDDGEPIVPLPLAQAPVVADAHETGSDSSSDIPTTATATTPHVGPLSQSTTESSDPPSSSGDGEDGEVATNRGTILDDSDTTGLSLGETAAGTGVVAAATDNLGSDADREEATPIESRPGAVICPDAGSDSEDDSTKSSKSLIPGRGYYQDIRSNSEDDLLHDESSVCNAVGDSSQSAPDYILDCGDLP
jgi:ubiquitin carboxyl-terminal hydrolase 4/11/15